MALSNASKAGTTIFLGVVQFTMAIILAEVYYPGYSVGQRTVSDLGATCTSGTCVVEQPSATIINLSVMLLGVLVLTGAFYIQRAFHWKPASGLIALAGVGAIGVGIFPETAGVLHGLFSLIAFLSSGLSAVVLARFQRKPLFYFSIILGSITLVALVLYLGGFDLGLGQGGMERMIIYPSLLWGIGFGGNLMSAE